MTGDAGRVPARGRGEGTGPAALARVVRTPPPFYGPRLPPVGGDAPEEFLARVPVTHRSDLLADQLAHLPFGTRRLPGAPGPVRLGVAGSGPDLLLLGWSPAELAAERAAGCRLLGRLGVRAGMRVANTLAGALVTPGSLLLGDVVEALGALDVPLGTIDGEAAARAAWDLVDRVEPAVLVLEGATAGPFFAAAPPRARPWWLGVVWLRRGAEVAAHRPPPSACGFAGWQRTWLAVPEATSFVAGSCAHGRFHLDEGVMGEVLAASPPGTCAVGDEGILTLTTLAGDTALLRFATAVRARTVRGPCACGDAGAAVELA